MSQPAQPTSPFQRQPVPPPGSLRRDTPHPLPEPQIWAAVASVGALFAFFGTILPWFLPEPNGANTDGVLDLAPTWAGSLVLMGVLSLWMLTAPTMRLRGAYLIATGCVVSAVAGFAFAFAKWLARQSLLANDPTAAAVDHGNPLLGMWMFLIGALFALVLGVAALIRLKYGPPARPAPPGRPPRWNPPPPPPSPLGPGEPHPGGQDKGPREKPDLVRPFRGHGVNVALPPYRGLSPQRGGTQEPADNRPYGAPRNGVG